MLKYRHVGWNVIGMYGSTLPCVGGTSFVSRLLTLLCIICVGCSSSIDTLHNMKVAIKKLARPFQSAVHAKRTYRELRMLKHMNHENVIGWYSTINISVLCS